jgi:ethanolamine utilization microcompartment shell protein EutS
MSEKRYLILTPPQIGYSIVNPDRDVLLHLDLDREETGLIGVEVVIRMTPTEARQVARGLLRKADEAEAGLPRA